MVNYIKKHKGKEINCKMCDKKIIKNGWNHFYCKKCTLINKKEKYLIKYGKYHNERFKLFKRDNFRCIYCGKSPIEDNIKIELDHIIPLSKGGKDANSNKITSCKECNLSKSDMQLTLEQVMRIQDIIKDR